MTNLYVLYKWIVAIPFIFITTMTLAGFTIIAGLFFGQNAAHLVAVLWAKLCCAIVPLKIALKGQDNYNKNNNYVIVANHQSMADIPLLHGKLGLHIKWIMKKELDKIPVFGSACRYLGCISIDRSNRAEAINSILQAKERLPNNACVCFFAEGTRSIDGTLKPFKKGAFRFAIETGSPILPVTIKNSKDALPSGSLDLNPALVELFVHPPIETQKASIDQIDKIIVQTRQAIASAL